MTGFICSKQLLSKRSNSWNDLPSRWEALVYKVGDELVETMSYVSSNFPYETIPLDEKVKLEQ
jgi:hypothetical protein